MPPHSVEFCIIPPEIDKSSPETRSKLGNVFSIAQQLQNYENMMMEVFKMQDIAEDERLAVMDAFIACHCILDQAMNLKSDRVIPQNNLIRFIDMSINTL